MLTPTDLRRLTGAGPGPRIEVLSPGAASSERISRSLVALANAQGGVLIVPLKLSRGAKPVNGDEVMEQALEALMAVQPRLIVPLPYLLRTAPELDPEALVIEIPEGLPNVFHVDGRYLIRDAGRNIALNARALRELLLTRSESTWEATTPTGSSNKSSTVASGIPEAPA